MVKQLLQKSTHIGLAGLILGLNGFFFLFFEKEVVSREFFSAKIAFSEPAPPPDPRTFHLSLQEQEDSVDTFDHWIRSASRKYALDPALVKAVIHAESRFDPSAVSPKGAVGLMQLDPITVRELGISDPFNPRHNIYCGVRYLRELLDTFEGDKHLALAAYNAGPNQVLRHNGIPPFKDTKKYISKVFRYHTYYKLNLFS